MTKRSPLYWTAKLALSATAACPAAVLAATPVHVQAPAPAAGVVTPATLATLAQTRWLPALCAAALMVLLLVMALAWMLHRWRVRQVVGRVRAQFERRLDERERVARELHDALLQSMHGLVMVINSTARRVTAHSERTIIENALLAADDVIQDGRERMRGLHYAGEIGNLFNALELHGKMLAQHVAIEFSAQLLGAPRYLHPAVGNEFHALGKEALSSAFRHADLTRVELLLQYGAGELRLTIRHNAKVPAPENQQAGGGSDPWHRSGMRERAHALGAQLQGQAHDSNGSSWLLTLPARLAYHNDEGNGPTDAWIDRLAKLFGRR